MKKTIQILIILIAIGFNSFAQTVDLKKGLVAYYPFNGNANDKSGNGNHGNIYGATLITDRNGKKTSAYYFDGNSDYLKISNSQLINFSSFFSIGLWIKPSEVKNGKRYQLIRKSRNAPGEAYEITINSNTKLFVGQRNSNNLERYLFSNSSIQPNDYSHILYVFTGNQIKIYINGTLNSSRQSNVIPAYSNTDLYIGKLKKKNGKYGYRYYNGIIDDIRIYNIALNEAEIQALFNHQELLTDAPVITFNNPNSTYSTVNQTKFNLNACIKSSEPLKNYLVYVHGTNNRGFNVVSSYDCDFKIDKSIYLQEGSNTIKIIAVNSGGSTTSPTYTVNYVKLVADKSPPEITITHPNVSRGFKAIEQNKQITISGKVKDESGIFEILINGQEASIDAQGNFSKTVLLAVGENSFTVKATDIKQNTATETFIIERQANQQDVVVVNNQKDNVTGLQTGKYYAFIIGNNSYKNPAITSLDKPIDDATRLYNTLTSNYTFGYQNVTFLKNATYIEMIEAFDNLSNKITENDNLLVFYAGHGWWDEKKEFGYWLLSNAKKRSTAFWIRNSTISDYMGSIKTKHTLLIADACFAEVFLSPEVHLLTQDKQLIRYTNCQIEQQ